MVTYGHLDFVKKLGLFVKKLGRRLLKICFKHKSLLQYDHYNHPDCKYLMDGQFLAEKKFFQTDYLTFAIDEVNWCNFPNG